MKFSTSLVPLLLGSVAASSIPARGLSWPGQSVVATEDKTQVPGDNPLTFCNGNHADDILVLDHVNLSPNPPEAYV